MRLKFFRKRDADSVSDKAKNRERKKEIGKFGWKGLVVLGTACAVAALGGCTQPLFKSPSDITLYLDSNENVRKAEYEVVKTKDPKIIPVLIDEFEGFASRTDYPSRDLAEETWLGENILSLICLIGKPAVPDMVDLLVENENEGTSDLAVAFFKRIKSAFAIPALNAHERTGYYSYWDYYETSYLSSTLGKIGDGRLDLGLEENGRELPKKRSPFPRVFWEETTEKMDVYERRELIETVLLSAGQLSSLDFEGILLAAAEDDDWYVRLVAIAGFAESHEYSQIIETVEKVAKDDNWYVRMWAMSTLGKIGSETSIKILVDGLNDENFEVRDEAMLALAGIGKPVIPEIMKIAEGEYGILENDQTIRAIWMLGQVKDSSTAPFLVDCLDVKGKSQFAKKALEGMGDSTVPALVAGLGRWGDEDIIEILKKSPDAAIPALLEASKGKKESSVGAAIALVGFGEKAYKEIAYLLKNGSKEVRSEIVGKLGWSEHKWAGDILIKALKDKDAEVRERAIWSLEKLEIKKAENALIAMLDDPDISVRNSAIYALDSFKSKKAIEPIIKLLINPNNTYDAGNALFNIGDITTIEPLLSTLKKSNNETVKISTVEAISGLISKLDEEIKTKSFEEVVKLFEIDKEKEKAGAELLKTLKAVSPYELYDFRKAMIDALGEFEYKKAVPKLISIMLDTSDASYIRAAAAKALGHIGGKKAVAALKKEYNKENKIQKKYDKLENKYLEIEEKFEKLPGGYDAYVWEDELNETIENPAWSEEKEELYWHMLDLRLELDNLTFGEMQVIDAAYNALHEIKIKSIDTFKSSKNTKKLITIMNDEKYDSSVRVKAAEALGEIGGSAALDALAKEADKLDELKAKYKKIIGSDYEGWWAHPFSVISPDMRKLMTDIDISSAARDALGKIEEKKIEKPNDKSSSSDFPVW